MVTDYSFLGLPQNSIVANPLYYPLRKSNDGNYEYSLPFKSNKAGLWVAYQPDRAPQSFEQLNLKYGMLAYIEINCQFRIGGKSATHYTMYQTNLDELLKRGILRETTYKEAFQALDIYEYYEELINQTTLRPVFQVADKSKGAVDLYNFEGGKPKIVDRIKELAQRFLPSPAYSNQTLL
jgi:hypothetical protein